MPDYPWRTSRKGNEYININCKRFVKFQDQDTGEWTIARYSPHRSESEARAEAERMVADEWIQLKDLYTDLAKERRPAVAIEAKPEPEAMNDNFPSNLAGEGEDAA